MKYILKLNLDYLFSFSLLWRKDAIWPKTNCSIKFNDVFVCNFAEFFTRFKNGLSAYYFTCILDVCAQMPLFRVMCTFKNVKPTIIVSIWWNHFFSHTSWQQNHSVQRTKIWKIWNPHILFHIMRYNISLSV